VCFRKGQESTAQQDDAGISTLLNNPGVRSLDVVAKPPRASKRQRVTSILARRQRGRSHDSNMSPNLPPSSIVNCWGRPRSLVGLCKGVFTRRRHSRFSRSNAECRAPQLLARTTCTELGTNLSTPNLDSHQTRILS
jgi:hypothetical protein